MPAPDHLHKRNPVTGLSPTMLLECYAVTEERQGEREKERKAYVHPSPPIVVSFKKESTTPENLSLTNKSLIAVF